jgi:hypothetical protein
LFTAQGTPHLKSSQSGKRLRSAGTIPALAAAGKNLKNVMVNRNEQHPS